MKAEREENGSSEYNTAGGGSYSNGQVQRDCLMTKEIAHAPQEHILHVKPQYFRDKEKGE